MFPTFDVPPQHQETVGARRARKEKERDSSRRNSVSTRSSEGARSPTFLSNPLVLPSSASVYSVASNSTSQSKPKSGKGFGLFKSLSREVKEISSWPKAPASEASKSPVASEPPPATVVLPAVVEQPVVEEEPQVQLPIEAPPSPLLPPSTPPPSSAVSSHAPSDVYDRYLRKDSVAPDEPLPPPSRGLPALPPARAVDHRAKPRWDRSPPTYSGRAVERRRPMVREKASWSTMSISTGSERTVVSSVFSAQSHHDDDILFEDLDDELSSVPHMEEVHHHHHKPQQQQQQQQQQLPQHPQQSLQPHVRPESRNQYANKFQMETVTEMRSQSRLNADPDASAKGSAAPTPFARALQKMENAGPRIISTRLSEEWEDLDDDESYQEVIFEKRLWALTAYQILTQGKHLQSPAHELLSGSRLADGRRILHLHGNLADGWMLATRYPTCTIYTVSSQNTSNLPTTYPAPLNHHSLYIPSISSSIPFPDSYFDAVISRSVTTSLRNEEWASTFYDYMRVLKPGGQIEILAIDPHMNRQGRQLMSWVDEHVVQKLEAHGMSMLPSDTVLDTMEIVGLQNIRRARIALPTNLRNPKVMKTPGVPGVPGAPSSAEVNDASRLMTYLGRHLYQDLYGKFIRAQEGDAWFWSDKSIRVECEKLQTKMLLTIACAQKPTMVHNGAYLDL